MPVADDYVPFKGLLRKGLDPSVVSELAEITHNVRSMRAQLWKSMTDPRRNVYDECGFPEAPVSTELYWTLFDRDALARRVIEVMPRECWQVTPTVTDDDDPNAETEFERAWDELGSGTEVLPSFYKDEQGSLVWDYLIRADIVSGIGQYGVVVLCLDDGLDPSSPAPGWDEVYSEPEVYPQYGASTAGTAPPASPEPDPLGQSWAERWKFSRNSVRNEREAGNPCRYRLTVNKAKTAGRKLIGVHVLPQVLAKVTAYEVNRSSPRFGQPVMYQVTFNDPREMNGEFGPPTGTRMWHWSRIVHLADNRIGNNIYGTERLRPVLNNVLSAQKPAFASAEGFWKCCFTLLSLETEDPEVDVDVASLRGMMENVQNGLQKYIWLKGLTAKSIAPTVLDPTPFVLTHVQQICIQLGIPQRVFMGSERGELASSQDDAAWNDRVKHRQQTYLTPWVVRPFVDRLVNLGVLPEPTGGYSVTWPDVGSTNATDKATVTLTRTQAMQAYVTAGVNTLMSPADWLTRELGYTEEEAETIVENAKQDQVDDVEHQAEVAQQQSDLGMGGPMDEATQTQEAHDASLEPDPEAA